jgi:putative PIN family toxin of toxin-antitoxin system
VRDGVADLVLSPALIAELADVIARPSFAAILARSCRTPERILTELRSLVDIVAAPPLPRPICRDPDDDAVLACALAARADLIVSGDYDLRILTMFKNIPIVAAAEALARLDR